MKIDIFVNELPLSVQQGLTVSELRDERAPQADIIIVNGYPSGDDYVLQEGDHVVLIRSGEIPDRE